jgi:hypothetical protein
MKGSANNRTYWSKLMTSAGATNRPDRRTTEDYSEKDFGKIVILSSFPYFTKNPPYSSTRDFLP